MGIVFLNEQNLNVKKGCSSEKKNERWTNEMDHWKNYRFLKTNEKTI